MITESKLKQYFIEFEEIQDSQIEYFNKLSPADSTKVYPDLDNAVFERNRAFENLRNALSLAPQSVLTSFKEEVDNILNKDKIFMAMLEQYKGGLSKKISQSLKGRQLLKGYSTGSTKSLRFMNNKI